MRSRYSNPYSPTSFMSSEDKAAKEKEARAKRLKAGVFSVGAIALLTFSMVWNPPTGKLHSFTKASDYVASRDSGCTNSGEGCHGEETDYTDFNDYHPNAKCTTCHDYQGVGCIPCHSPSGHECQSCHDGTLEAAGDRTRIVDPYPRGHYRETTHTVTGTDMKAVMRTSEDGEAEAACTDCHARDLYAAHQKVPQAEGSPYGDSVGCGECHNDTRSAGLAQMKHEWKNRSCEDCHAKKTSSPMHAANVAPSTEPSGGPGCESTGKGCHDVKDLHALHPDAPDNCSGSAAKGEPGCHDLNLQAHVPTATACGGSGDSACHAPYQNEELAHDKDKEVHSPGTAVANDTSYFDIACGDCHEMSDDGVSLITEHALSTSDQAEGGPCGGCHNNPAGAEAVKTDWPERDKTTACNSCHGSGGIDAVHDTDIADTHVASNSAGCASSGAGCHPTSDISSDSEGTGGAALHDSCLICHEEFDPTANSCGAGRACHNSGGFYTRASLQHEAANGDTTNGRDDLHTAGTAQRSERATDEASGVTYSCGDCHSMILGSEHTRPNSAIARDGAGTCPLCHNANARTAATVKSGWPTSGTDKACETCHVSSLTAHSAISTEHLGTSLDATGVAKASACANESCHKTLDLRILHKETGCKTKGCHQTGGDIRGLNITTCGGTNTAIACHTGMHKDVNGYDPLHYAGDVQGAVSIEDTVSGLLPKCLECHTMAITTEHERVNSTIATGTATVCVRCHDANDATRAVVDGDWAARDTVYACLACHTVTSDMNAHARIGDVHYAVERSADGSASPGACATVGCHARTDVRRIHRAVGCAFSGCHQPSDDVRGDNTMSCGGNDRAVSCHNGLTATDHRQSHSADLTGTVEGVTYLPGENVGCFGCHKADLMLEHSAALQAGSMDGGGSGACRVCHYDADDPDNGDYSNIPAVRNAIANHDRRCIACHRSGSAEDTATGVASPHKAISSDATLPAGKVSSDPMDDWREALDSVTGGGHNALSASVVGASRNKVFPLTSFNIGGTTYAWTLAPNTGTAAWLRTQEVTATKPGEGPTDALVFPGANTTESIQAQTVTCDDCHQMADMTGPQGAAVEISIDPDYSQTEYASPSAGTFQFDPYNIDAANGNNPAGYKPVICVKCHLVYAHSVVGTTTTYVGGNGLHNTHRSRHAIPTKGRNEACSDCHLRIPHAWKRPRLLLRTVDATAQPDVAPDAWPYAPVNNTGLIGIKLFSWSPMTGTNARPSCATNGCYANASPTSHPKPSQLATDQAFWP